MKNLAIPYKEPLKVKIGSVKTSYVIMLNVFWLSILLFSICYTFSASLYSLAAVFQGIQILSIAAFFFSLFHLIEIKNTNSYFLFFTGVFIAWQVTLIIRGEYAFMDYEDTKSMFFDANYGIFCLFIPLISLIKPTIIQLKKFFDALVISGVVYLGFCLFFLPDMIQGDLLDPVSRELVETSVKFLAFPSLLFLIFSPFQSIKRMFLGALVFLFFMAFAAIKARRGVLMMGGFAMTVALVFMLFRSNRKLSWILLGLYILALLYQLLLVEFSFGEVKLLSSLFDKGLENTRAYVEDCFFSSMTPMDWIIGKGYNAGYFCPGIDESIFKQGIRRVIETDYFQFILTGGLINLGLILLIMLPAVALGLFYSKNIFCKAAASWILIWLVFLYPSNGFTFSIYHVSVWMMASICFNGSFRKLDENVLRKYFGLDLKLNNREKA